MVTNIATTVVENLLYITLPRRTIKLKIGECQLCKRKLEKQEECCAFDFDHIDAKLKQSKIADMVAKYTLKRFKQCIDLEIAKCRLICCMCHRDHTRKQRREKTAAVQELAFRN